MLYKIAFVNGKGGVGKTTGIFQVAGVLSSMGEKVLVVDLDKQRNATSTLMMNNLDSMPGMTAFDVLMGRCRPADATAEAMWRSRGNANPKYYGTSCMVGDLRFEDVTLYKDVAQKGAGFGKVLDEFAEGEGFRFMLVDMPPSNAVLNNLCFAHVVDHIIVPFTSDVYSVQGYGDIMDTVASARALNPELNVLGIYLSRYGTSSVQAWVHSKLQEFGDIFIDVQIPQATDIIECAVVGSPISYYRNTEKSRSRRAYERLVDEMLRRLSYKKEGAV